MSKTVFILGGAGFIGREVVTQALQAEWSVKTLVRSAEKASTLQKLGAYPVVGDIYQPETWIDEVRNCTALIDLTQPEFPKRLSRSAMKALAAQRLKMTQTLVEALKTLPEEQRLVFFSISGADDLEPDAQGTIHERSPLRSHIIGFGTIGIPVRRLIEASGIDATFVYFGSLVYGPGKVFADQFVAALKRGSARVVGKGTNRLPLVHVTDAARAVVHLADLPRSELVGRTFLVADGADTTLRELFSYTATSMSVKQPGTAPAWLAALIAGEVAVETITVDAHADASALLGTGFHFLYPSYRQGVPATLAALGYTTSHKD